MIGKLKGVIEYVGENNCIIDVAGVGYNVFCSSKTLMNLSVGEACSMLIETHVREDHIHLYGFMSEEEKVAFGILQSVKGVGTRMALAVLSALSPAEIQSALQMQDTTAFNMVSGVGKKLAERIITELKDKTISTVQINVSNSEFKSVSSASSDKGDAITALTQLGVSKADAENRVNRVLSKNPNSDLGEIIRLALQN